MFENLISRSCCAQFVGTNLRSFFDTFCVRQFTWRNYVGNVIHETFMELYMFYMVRNLLKLFISSWNLLKRTFVQHTEIFGEFEDLEKELFEMYFVFPLEFNYLNQVLSIETKNVKSHGALWALQKQRLEFKFKPT